MTEIDEPKEVDYEEFMDYTGKEGVYLSGPIRCLDNNGVEWRDSIIEDYNDVVFNNPLDNYSPEEADILNDPLHLDSESQKEQVLPSEYVMEDKMMINRSEAVFVGLPEAIARGTMMELMYAYMRNIPFFVWTIDGQEESGWIYEHAEYMDDNRDWVMGEVKECLNST